MIDCRNIFGCTAKDTANIDMALLNDTLRPK